MYHLPFFTYFFTFHFHVLSHTLFFIFINELSFCSRCWVTSTQWGRHITPRAPRPGASLQRYVYSVFVFLSCPAFSQTISWAQTSKLDNIIWFNIVFKAELKSEIQCKFCVFPPDDRYPSCPPGWRLFPSLQLCISQPRNPLWTGSHLYTECKDKHTDGIKLVQIRHRKWKTTIEKIFGPQLCTKNLFVF